MISFQGRAILLDIEGTTSSISFVYDVLFPYVRTHLEAFLKKNWGNVDVVAACNLIAKDTGANSLATWCLGLQQNEAVEKMRIEVNRLMNADSKSTGLKQLQGLISREGYASGELRSHVYPDVPPALKNWTDKNIDVRIYSSGSIQAQSQFFGHTIAGDLLGFFKGHYDTTTGPKREISSYTKIAENIKQPPAQILFLSDVAEELDAARGAGMRTGLVVRPGNKVPAFGHTHPRIKSFDEIKIS